MYPEDYKNTFKTVFVVITCVNVLMRITVAFQAYSFSVHLAHTTTGMRVDPCGSSGRENKEILKMYFLVFFIVVDDALFFFAFKTFSNDLSTAFWVFYYIGPTNYFVFAIYILIIGIRKCSAIRQKSNIPVGKYTGKQKGNENCVCVFWSPCCSTQQLKRHTADYEAYDTEWCSTPV